jgi:hypothetical protein
MHIFYHLLISTKLNWLMNCCIYMSIRIAVSVYLLHFICAFMLGCRLSSRLPSSLTLGAVHWNCPATKTTRSTLCYGSVCLIVNCRVKLTGTPATQSAQGNPRSRDLPAPVLLADPSEASVACRAFSVPTDLFYFWGLVWEEIVVMKLI